MSEKILEVRQLATSFHTERGWQQAIDGVSFDVYQGEILGIVGESGCGKSVTSQSIMRLYDERRLVRYSGTVKLEGQSLLDIPQDAGHPRFACVDDFSGRIKFPEPCADHLRPNQRAAAHSSASVEESGA